MGFGSPTAAKLPKRQRRTGAEAGEHPLIDYGPQLRRDPREHVNHLLAPIARQARRRGRALPTGLHGTRLPSGTRSVLRFPWLEWGLSRRPWRYRSAVRDLIRSTVARPPTNGPPKDSALTSSARSSGAGSWPLRQNALAASPAAARERSATIAGTRPRSTTIRETG